jgi:phosphotransferase system enzyme I (PtsI)
LVKAKKRSIQGISVAGGLAIGPVHVVRADEGAVPTWSVPESELERERERLRAALELSQTELRRRQDLVAQQASAKDAEIIAVHRMLLQGPSALERVESTLREQRINAEAAVQLLIEGFERRLGGLEGESLRGLAAEFSDPWRLVLDVLLRRERDEIERMQGQVVLAAADLTPQVVTFVERRRVLAVIAETGGRFSHGAVLARSFGIPCVVGLPNLISRLEQGMRVTVDGDSGVVQLRPDDEDVDEFLGRIARGRLARRALAEHAALPAATADGHPLGVQVNIESVRDLETFQIEHTDGIGLLRTEFMYLERPEFPSEEEQYRLYRRVLEHMGGRPVTLRTLDIGGDKQLPYFETPGEPNPALGWRGLRITLEWQDLLRVQLRAALRASAHGELRLLLPMVTSLEEVLAVHRIFDELRRQLVEHGYEIASQVPVGVMIEIPSLLFVLPELLREVDFVSVGTNDLVQYMLAVDRDNSLVARLYDPSHPAVIQALRRVAEESRAAGKPCSVCGEMAGDPATAILLVGLGFGAISVAPAFVPEIKDAFRRVTEAEARELAERCLAARRGEEVRQALESTRRLLHGRQLVALQGATLPGEELSEKGDGA